MNTENAMDCSSRIKLERQKRSWSQEQLAERAKLSARTVQRIECGADVSPETLRLIAEAFGVPAETLRGVAARTHFGAPWGRSVKAITWTVLGLLAALYVVQAVFQQRHLTLIVNILTFGAVLPCLVLGVHGFSVKDGKLLIHRLGWATAFDLAKLSGFEINPRATMGSIRLFGNGGIFCFVGFFRNAILGRYRAYATDLERCVVLVFGDRKVVVTPDDPEAFVDALRESIKGICS